MQAHSGKQVLFHIWDFPTKTPNINMKIRSRNIALALRSISTVRQRLSFELLHFIHGQIVLATDLNYKNKTKFDVK